jgi:hypothetical protein
MDTEKEYPYPYVVCSGHLQGVCMTAATMLDFIADYMEDDLYTVQELKVKIKHQVKMLEQAHKDVDLVLKNHYETITKGLK